jgi:hypothetical protein
MTVTRLRARGMDFNVVQLFFSVSNTSIVPTTSTGPPAVRPSESSMPTGIFAHSGERAPQRRHRRQRRPTLCLAVVKPKPCFRDTSRSFLYRGGGNRRAHRISCRSRPQPRGGGDRIGLQLVPSVGFGIIGPKYAERLGLEIHATIDMLGLHSLAAIDVETPVDCGTDDLVRTLWDRLHWRPDHQDRRC